MFRILTPAIMALAVAFLPLAAPAQGVETRIERIEKQLRAVQRKVFGTDVGGQPATDEGATGNRMADVEVRLQGIESQIRTLNGQVEELRFQMEENNRRLEKFQADAEFRFGQLEGGKPPADAAAASASVPPAPASPAAKPDVAAAAPLPSGSAMEQYDYAYNLLAQGEYARAELAFREFLARHGKDDLAGNAQYWLGQSYFVRGQYQEAAKEFLTGYQDYPDSPKAPAYLLKIGITLTKIGQNNDACDVFRELASRHPDSPEAKTRMAAARTEAGCQ